jgi:hypothetical protein
VLAVHFYPIQIHLLFIQLRDTDALWQKGQVEGW